MGRFVGWTLGVVFALAISVAPAAAQSWSVGVHIGSGPVYGPVYGGPPPVYYPPVYRAPVYRAPVYPDPYYYDGYYDPYYRPAYRSYYRPAYSGVVVVGGGYRGYSNRGYAYGRGPSHGGHGGNGNHGGHGKGGHGNGGGHRR